MIVTSIEFRRRGIEARLIVNGHGVSDTTPDAKLIVAIASVRKLAARDKVDPSHVSRILPLAFLAPGVVSAILEGWIDPGFTLSRIKRLKLPPSWAAQRDLFGLH